MQSRGVTIVAFIEHLPLDGRYRWKDEQEGERRGHQSHVLALECRRYSWCRRVLSTAIPEKNTNGPVSGNVLVEDTNLVTQHEDSREYATDVLPFPVHSPTLRPEWHAIRLLGS